MADLVVTKQLGFLDEPLIDVGERSVPPALAPEDPVQMETAWV
jgi:hypothetical protein